MKATLAMVILLTATGMAFGNDNKNQREDCNRKAEGTTGSERTSIISACIRHNARINTVPSVLGKITECNRKAGDMEGDARIAFVDNCLKEP